MLKNVTKGCLGLTFMEFIVKLLVLKSTLGEKFSCSYLKVVQVKFIYNSSISVLHPLKSISLIVCIYIYI